MIFSVLAKQIFFTCSKMKLLTNFMIFVATKNGGTKRIPPPLSLCLCFFFQVLSSLFHFESPNLCFFMGWGAVQGITNNLAGRPLGRGFVLWAVLCGHAPLPERFCVWAAFAGLSCWQLCGPPSPPPFAYVLFFQVFSSPFHFESPNFGRNGWCVIPLLTLA